MIAVHLAMMLSGTAAYTLFLTCGESRLFAAGMTLAAAFLPMHVMLT